MSDVLAVVPARAGSKGVPNKNMARLGGVSLIERAIRCIAAADIDCDIVLSTDSESYAEEGRRCGATVEELRPHAIAQDDSSAFDVLLHEFRRHEKRTGSISEAVLWVEPTSPLRRPEDLVRALALYRSEPVDTVVTVSPLPTGAHPDKLLIATPMLRHHTSHGPNVRNRQQLAGTFLVRNGICYVVGRRAIEQRLGFITDRSMAMVIDRPIANIDDPVDLAWAEFLLEREGNP